MSGEESNNIREQQHTKQQKLDFRNGIVRVVGNRQSTHRVQVGLGKYYRQR
eukprot:CAMPEP_0117042046 /NCGR_PEP_ID=MMETSP0472-20121206/29311_1 /TAXON_ID=693140 ORGANISM="Tiarina fusus, Strain LIS" /NCGR_SAMPLE_ID=MMETSP0472 /ASSEMBLY_ACC=CAM_ASM_000603 /LENGTH=50 /DNA_ID=CAMNT_0004753193 /DNA_START=95 /DNA_END=247 /DNA_ORIENTATION=-